jgi:SAM-dependent methyltransferase
MDEFLALMEFRVVGTSISPHEIQDAQARVKSIEEKHLKADLEFRTAPMESVADYVQDCLPFDAVFVYEALHHAYDWRQAIESSYVCLKPDGWLLIANEPNLIHTLVSYRVALLSNTHEIGFTRSELIQHLKKTGFKNIRILKNSLGFYIRPHWIMCQR